MNELLFWIVTIGIGVLIAWHVIIIVDRIVKRNIRREQEERTTTLQWRVHTKKKEKGVNK